MTGSFWARRVGDGVHAVRGTRGLTLAAGLLLLLAAVEPAFPAGFPRLVYSLPLLVLLIVGLVTLPQEAVAVQARARSLVTRPDATKRMARRAGWGVAVCVALAPNLFLAVQGVPHLSPLAGLVLPGVVRWVGLVGMLVVLLLVVLYLRSSRSYAPEIDTKRARELDEDETARRDVAGLCLIVVVVAWGWMLQGFWQPFSLLQWHGLDLSGWFSSLGRGARGISGLAFAVLPPALLFIVMSAHLDLLWQLRKAGVWSEQPKVAGLAFLHAGLCVVAVVFHMYGVTWIVRFRSWGFL